ncbi:MAG: bifunctional enoyl-CoA hydratase/phosphate acetyltransferase [Ectothiorhodospiraceae bacterium]|nr:bifunctional enoyl-CoA hydratase/phosphate acetyltransferase [Ectothiorhodospiraceae bacterium]
MTDEQIRNTPFDELEHGQRAELRRKLTMGDLRAQASRKDDPLDPDQVSEELYYRIVTHGMWATGLIALAVAPRLPGPGSRLLGHELRYHEPVSLGDMVTVRLTVREKRADREVVLDCRCLGEGDRDVVTGTVLVEAPAEHISEASGDLDADQEGGRRRQMKRLLRMAEGLPALRTAVVHPVDVYSLSGAVDAYTRGLIEPVLSGPEHRIRKAADQAGLSLEDLELIDTEHSHAAAAQAVELAREGDVAALMKGALHTDEFMQSIVARNSGLRTGRRMSHAWVMDVPTYPRPLIITDSALNIRPDLSTKADIARNVIELAQAMGVERPKVAILSATEEVNPQLQSTLDAAALCKMADRGQIKGGELDGPLAFDNAISEVAARTKGIRSSVAGHPDILLAPDLESANMLGKQLRYLADAETAGIVMGARVPVVLTSRADDRFSRIASCAIAVLMANRERKA